jgi:hypothetical protein
MSAVHLCICDLKYFWVIYYLSDRNYEGIGWHMRMAARGQFHKNYIIHLTKSKTVEVHYART